MRFTRTFTVNRTIAVAVAASIALTGNQAVAQEATPVDPPAAVVQNENTNVTPQTKAVIAVMGDKNVDPINGIANLSDLPADVTVAWKDGVNTESIGTKNVPATVTYADGSTVDVNIPVTVVLNQADYEATLKELGELQDKTKELETHLDTGLARCVGTIGGSFLALMPAVAIASQLIGGLRIPSLDAFLKDVQSGLNGFHPGLARAVDLNRGAIAAAFAGVAVTGLALAPTTCRDTSVGGAIAEPLSSEK